MIRVNSESLKIDHDIFIVFGESLQEILDELKASGVALPETPVAEKN